MKTKIEERLRLTRDEQLTVLADCQRIVADPSRAGYLVHAVGILRRSPRTPKVTADVPAIPSVERARRLGVGVVFVDRAPAGGEIRRDVYDHVFRYPVKATSGPRWKQTFGRALSIALDRHVEAAADDATHGEEAAAC